jgi:hypothetical protein
MRRLLSVVLSVGGVGTFLLGTTMLSASSASASTTGYCPTAKGVTVVVDFRALGGDVQIRCDTGATSSTTGLTALHGAGFSTAGTYHDGAGFVCRINSQPPTSAEKCLLTPPATAYWSYWHAPNGGSWTYSSFGAMGRDVIVGGFEGWSFHKGSGSANPPGARATRPPPPPVPTYKLGPAASAKAKASASAARSSASSSAAAKATSSKPATTTATSSAGPSDPPTTPDGSSTSADVQAGGQLPGDDPPDGGSPWPFVIGLGAVALVGAGAGVVVYQRHRADGV